MDNINSEYYIVTRNPKNDTNMEIEQACETGIWADEDVIKPIHYTIDEYEYKYKEGMIPRDLIEAGIKGILIRDYLKEEFFYKYNPDKIKLHPAYITSPDKKTFFEGYWLAMRNTAPKEWLDVENSEMDFHPKPRPGKSKYMGIKRYQLNTTILKEIPVEERLFFRLPYEYHSTDIIIHDTIVTYLLKVESSKRDVAFVPLDKYYNSMSAEDFSKYAI